MTILVDDEILKTDESNEGIMEQWACIHRDPGAVEARKYILFQSHP